MLIKMIFDTICIFFLYLYFHYWSLRKILDNYGSISMSLETFMCINVNLHISMILYIKQCGISITASGKENFRIFTKISLFQTLYYPLHMNSLFHLCTSKCLPPKDHPSKVWVHFVQHFSRRRLRFEQKFTMKYHVQAMDRH